MTYKPYKVQVFGGRDFEEKDLMYQALDYLHSLNAITLIIEGGAKGADRLGRSWAKERGIPFVTIAAEWDKCDKAAGIIRNTRIANEFTPHAALMAPGGTGTADMLEKLQAKGVAVWELNP